MHPLTPTALPLKEFAALYAASEGINKSPVDGRPVPRPWDIVRATWGHWAYRSSFRHLYRDYPRAELSEGGRTRKRGPASRAARRAGGTSYPSPKVGLLSGVGVPRADPSARARYVDALPTGGGPAGRGSIDRAASRKAPACGRSASCSPATSSSC